MTPVTLQFLGLNFAPVEGMAGLPLSMGHAPGLVLLSVLVAFLANSSALNTLPLIISAQSQAQRLLWLTGGSVVMGGGVWAMHFIAALALQLPVPVQYEAGYTLLSVVPAILAAMAALWLLVRRRVSHRRLIFASVLLGGGIGLMHYTGMAAMRVSGVQVYSPLLFLVSLLVAVLLSYLALRTLLKLNQETTLRRPWLSAAIFCLATVLMHYTAMAAMSIYPVDSAPKVSLELNDLMLEILLSGFVLLFVGPVYLIAHNRSLLEKNTLLGSILEETIDGVILVNLKGEVELFSRAAEKILGYSETEVLGREVSLFVPSVLRSQHRQYIADAERGQEKQVMGRSREVMALHRDGHQVPVDIGVSRILFGAKRGYVVTLHDLTEQRQTQLELSKLSQVIEQSPLSIMLTSRDHAIQYVNPKLCEVTGYSAQELLFRSPEVLHVPDLATREEILLQLNAGNSWRGEMHSRRKNGEMFLESATVVPVCDANGEVIQTLWLTEDISQQKEVADRLYKESHFSSLTGQLNKQSMMQYLQGLVEQGREFGLLFIDLLGLKHVNDNLGFELGDKLIRSCAERLNSVICPPQRVAHLGGGQFLIATAEGPGEAVDHLVTRVMRQFQSQLLIGELSLYQRIAVGVAFCPGDGGVPQEVLSHAHAALNLAKERGQDGFAYYSSDKSLMQQEKFRMEQLLQQAVLENELELYFQPKVDANSGRFIGAEALLRWTSKVLGPVSPAEFIPLAEKSCLILTLGEWVLEQCCLEINQMRAMGLTDFSVSVNASAKQFSRSNFVTLVADNLERYGFPPEMLEIEVTESLLMEEEESVFEQLQALEELGVKLALDDFGTGYSSLAYLQRYPFDTLKIDQSFVRSLPHSKRSMELTRAIIQLARSFNMMLVAEGVETEEQATCLRGEGCQIFQGYLYAKPMNSSNLMRWLRDYDQPGTDGSSDSMQF